MKLVLDTHTFIWAVSEPEKLSARARTVIASTDNDVLWSAAGSWEIAIKVALGKLGLSDSPERFVTRHVLALGLTPLPIRDDHAFEAGALSPHHRDPFDRMLVAQARIEDAAIVTNDPHIAAYGVRVEW